MLTFESNAVQGTSGIVEKLVGLPFQKIKHQVATLDAQPSSEQGGILVMVTGALLVRPPMAATSFNQDHIYIFKGEWRLSKLHRSTKKNDR